MVQRLILLFLVIIGIGILIFRLSDSGAEISRRKQFFTNPFTILFEYTFGTSTPLNKHPFPFPSTPDIPDEYPTLVFDNADSAGTDLSERSLHDLENTYDNLTARIADAQNFGNPSPYRGLVSIMKTSSGSSVNDAKEEYIVLETSSKNTAPISISGWTVQSVYSRGRYKIPNGTRHFIMGAVPDMRPIMLDPGDRALISSGVSPVGTSFKENMCTGYLAQFQTFVPELTENCPDPEKEALSEPATSRTADPACVAYAQSIPICRFIFGDPPKVSSSCAAFLRNTLTYNGCTMRHSWRPSFDGDTWRVFLGASGELWSNDHEVVRLLDAQGRTVDVWSY